MALSKERVEYYALIAEIVGGFGVIISVIYLAVQVGDGNNELKAQNHSNALALAQKPMEMLIADKELAQLKVVARTNRSDLSEADKERLEHYDFLLFNSWEFSYYQNQEDNIPPDLWFGHDGWMRGEVKSDPSFEVSWRLVEHAFGIPFREYVNELFRQNKDGKLEMR